MAEPLNSILKDSEQAAQVYARLVNESNVDTKLWDFVEMGKDHEKIVGHVKRTLPQVGQQPGDKTRDNWPELKKHPSLRVYEDPTALRVLRDAETDELMDCRKLLELESDRAVNTLAASNIMPVLSAHIETLDRYLERARVK